MPSPGNSPHAANRMRLHRRNLRRAVMLRRSIPGSRHRNLRRVALLRLSTPSGRRRKKQILTAELPRLEDLIEAVAHDHRTWKVRG